MKKLPEKSSARALVDTGAAMAISAIPLVGGAFSIAFQEVMGRAYKEQLNVWLNSLANGLEELIERVDGLTLDNLAENENFLDAVSAATFVATRTRKKEKIEALRNAVLNTAMNHSMEADKQGIFLQMIAELTPSHLLLLELLDNPPRYFERVGVEWPNIMFGGRSALVELVFPLWTSEYYGQLVRQLRNNGLVSVDSLQGIVTGEGLTSRVTSNLGKEFLAFIAEPIQ